MSALALIFVYNWHPSQIAAYDNNTTGEEIAGTVKKILPQTIKTKTLIWRLEPAVSFNEIVFGSATRCG